jgi:hypothetical protein
VNSNGAFFKAKDSTGALLSVGARGYTGGTLKAQAAILIHELGHILDAAGFTPDFGDAKAGKLNDNLVDKNCGKLIGGLK